MWSILSCVCVCVCVCVWAWACMCACSKAKSSFPPSMITGTIDCNTDEQARSARGAQRNLDMFKALTFMFFHAGMKLNSDVAGSWLSLKKHDVKQRAWLAKVNRSGSHGRRRLTADASRKWEGLQKTSCKFKNGHPDNAYRWTTRYLLTIYI